MSWRKFGFAAPELAAFGAAMLTKRLAYLATIRADGALRVHPVSPFISHDTLFVYMEPTSPKGKDLRRDGRYAMHCSVEDESGGGGEFCVRGRAVVVDEPQTRGKAFDAARAIGYKPNDRYVLFELGVEEALATTYEDGVPVRRRWRPGN
ncbi:MAG: pyridoxamine 5'-phosphate oxidase family protein [Acidobacteriota bacterium]